MSRFTNVKNYLSDVGGELKKTSFPSREQTIGSSVVVIVMVIFMSIFLAMTDLLLSKIVGIILQ